MIRQFSVITFLAITACGGQERAFEGGLAGECSDGQDNDGDGKTDCDDSDCALHLDCNGGQAGTQTITTTTTTTDEGRHGWDCEEEVLEGLNKNGTLMLEGNGTSVAGLCSGEFMVAMDSEVHWLDISGALYGYYPLSEDVMKLTIDKVSETLWASHNESKVVSQIDLGATAYTMSEHVLLGVVRRTAAGMTGQLFVATEETTTDNTGTHISLIDATDGASAETWELGEYGQRMAFDTLNSQLIMGDSNITMFSYKSGALVAKPTMTVVNVCSGGRGEMTISQDSQHLVYPCVNGNGQGINMVDFSPIDLSSAGTYSIADKVGSRGAVFSPNGNFLLATDNTSTYIFDANTHELLTNNTPDTDQCLSPSLVEMAWSPLGAGVYTVWSCSSEEHGSQVSWWFPTFGATTTTTGETGETGDTTTTTTTTTTDTGTSATTK
jgi:hypothetical protein